MGGDREALTMYVPPIFAATDETAWRIMQDHPFGILLRHGSVEPAPLVWLADPQGGRLFGHLARANPAVPEIPEPATVLFQGPHGYVSPRWYRDPTAHVPTWNYVLAQAEGELRPLGRDETLAVITALCARFEPPDGYRPEATRPGLIDGLLSAIVGVELRVTRVTAKLKLSQNRAPADREGVLAALAESGPSAEPDLLDWMRR